MDKKAWIVVSLCSVLLILNWTMGNKEESTPAQTPQGQPAAAAPATQPDSATTGTPTPAANGQPAPQTPAATATPGVVASPAAPTEAQPQIIATLTSRDAEGKPVSRYDIQDIGGSVRSIDMLGQAVDSTREGLKGDVSLNGSAPQGVGTLAFAMNGGSAPLYDRTVYRVIPEYTNDGQVMIIGQLGDLLVRKTFKLKPLEERGENVRGNAYVITMTIDVQNTGKTPLSVKNWGIYGGAVGPISKHENPSMYVSYVVEDNGDFSKHGVSDFSHWMSHDESFRYVTDCDKLDWVGLMNQYYATVLMPHQGSDVNNYFAAPLKLHTVGTNQKTDGLEVVLGVPDFELSPKTDGARGGARSLGYDFFAGPKLNTMLSGMTDNFRKIDRVMDYGIFYIISYPMNWLINVFHSWFGNWGWAIVAMTFVVRAIIWPLYRKSYVSMKRMSALQPKMQELKEKYPDDPQRVQVEMMKLYREYGINPIGGCLPMLLQMPIFLSFFYVLQTAAELRGAKWLGWVQDLSLPDTVYEIPMPFSLPFLGDVLPINVLPFLMITSMIVMMSMTPQTGGDKTQRMVMRIMPLFFFLFCYNYASALALYWTTTNIISMIQTLIIRRLPMPEPKKVDPKKQSKWALKIKHMMEEEQKRQASMRNVTRR